MLIARSVPEDCVSKQKYLNEDGYSNDNDSNQSFPNRDGIVTEGCNATEWKGPRNQGRGV